MYQGYIFKCILVLIACLALMSGHFVVTQALENPLSNSNSKERAYAWCNNTLKGMNLLERGYFSFYDGNAITKDNPWIFTKAAWEKYQADPQFPLAEGQHITEVKELY